MCRREPAIPRNGLPSWGSGTNHSPEWTSLLEDTWKCTRMKAIVHQRARHSVIVARRSFKVSTFCFDRSASRRYLEHELSLRLYNLVLARWIRWLEQTGTWVNSGNTPPALELEVSNVYCTVRVWLSISLVIYPFTEQRHLQDKIIKGLLSFVIPKVQPAAHVIIFDVACIINDVHSCCSHDQERNTSAKYKHLNNRLCLRSHVWWKTSFVGWS